MITFDKPETHIFAIWNSSLEVIMIWVLLIATGAAYGRAETALREFVEMSGLPFLPTPMGKGVLPDDHPNCVAAARSRFPFF